MLIHSLAQRVAAERGKLYWALSFRDCTLIRDTCACAGEERLLLQKGNEASF